MSANWITALHTLANSAAHEISRLFGTGHSVGAGWNLMHVEVESIEAGNNKYFNNTDHQILLSAFGARPVRGFLCVVDAALKLVEILYVKSTS